MDGLVTICYGNTLHSRGSEVSHGPQHSTSQGRDNESGMERGSFIKRQ